MGQGKVSYHGAPSLFRSVMIVCLGVILSCSRAPALTIMSAAMRL